ncbi:MAG TPA: 6-hydroxymethylpterin diphosphokinase MptE-like protein [Vicinamibacterales bacterium]
MTGADLAALNRRAHQEAWDVPPGGAARTRVTVDGSGPFPVLRMAREDGSWIALNSARAPVREARQQLADLDLSAASVLVVVGAGLGFLLDALAEIEPRPPVAVLEPCGAFVDACLGRRDWSAWIREQRLLVSCGPDFPELAAIGRTHPDLFLTPVTLVSPVLDRELPGFVRAARASVERVRAGAHANADARRRFAAPYLLNTLANLPVLEREADVDALEGAAADMPAVVVGAGPSLDGALEDLRAASGRVVIVATDTAARPLLGAGIVPHAIVSVDPSPVNGRHLLELPGDAPVLVAEASLWPPAFEGFAGRTFLFRVGRHHPWPWLEDAGLGVGMLRAWGSVITSSVDFALRLGCPRIALVGADCAAVNGQPYARGTTFEAIWTSRVLAGRPLPDIWREIVSSWKGPHEHDAAGRLLESGPHLLAFRDWLLEEGRRRPGVLFNASGQGLLVGDGIVPAALGEYVARFGRETSGVADALHRRHRAARRTNARQSRPPIPDAWRAVLEDGGLDAGLAAAVVEQGPAMWMGDDLPSTPVAAPMAEAAAVLDATVRRARIPAWAIRALAAVPASMRLPYGRRLIPELLRVEGSLDRSWLPSQAAGLLPADRALLARVETAAGAALARLVAASPAGEPPLCVAADARTPAHLPKPAALAATLVALAGDLDGLHGQDARVAALAVTSLRGLAAAVDPRHPSSPIDAIALEIAVEDGRQRAEGVLPVSASALVRALAGTVFSDRVTPTTVWWTARIGGSVPPGQLCASWKHRADDRGRPEVLHIRPRALESSGACLFARSSGQTARVTTLLGRTTWVVDEDGASRAETTWPEQVLGEIAIGESGLVAWSPAGTPALWFRSDADAEAQRMDLPFAPAVGCAMNGQVYLAGVSGGLWSWNPVRGTELVADCEPLRGLHPDAGGLRLDPVQLSRTGTTTAVPLRRAWRLDPLSRELEPLTLDERGPTWSISRSPSGWTARAFPCAGAVELESPAGRLFTLICPFPFSVAWAGESLVVTCTTAGEVWFYERLAARLQRLESSGE